MHVHLDECEAAGVEPQEIAALARRLDRIGKDMDRLGIQVFGGSGTGSIRRNSLILAVLSHGNWDGGDGAYGVAADGRLRAEYAE